MGVVNSLAYATDRVGSRVHYGAQQIAGTNIDQIPHIVENASYPAELLWSQRLLPLYSAPCADESH